MALFVVVAYVLFGSSSLTAEGAACSSGSPSTCQPDKGFRAVGLFLFLLVLLAAVEALHISVPLAAVKDLNAVRDKFPRTFAAHRIFRHERGTGRFSRRPAALRHHDRVLSPPP